MTQATSTGNKTLISSTARACEVNFKRIDGGWLYRAPALALGLIDPPHYRVSDQQKSEIITILSSRTMLALAVAAMLLPVFIVTGLIFWAAYVPGRPVMFSTAAVAFVLSLAAVFVSLSGFVLFQRHRLGAVLSQARASSDHISRKEVAESFKKVATPRDLLRNFMLYCIASAALALGTAINLVEHGNTATVLFPGLAFVVSLILAVMTYVNLRDRI
jgi:hypothetical protein